MSYAEAYANQGWSVFPIRPNSKFPLTEHGFKDATKDLEQIRKWWDQWPEANIGVAAGRDSGVVVLDIDRKHGVDGVVAAAELDLPETLTVKTPSGGFHAIFQMPPGVVIPRKIGVKPGLDILGEGGYFIAAGSIINGASYHIVRNVPIAPCPQSIIDLASSAKVIAGEATAPLTRATLAIEGERNKYLASFAGRMRRIGGTIDEIEAALIVVNTTRCKPPLPETEVRRTAQSVARYTPDQSASEQADTTTPVVTRSIAELLGADFPPPEFLMDPVLRHPGISLWFGPSGISKTYLVLGMSLALASGRDFLNWHVTKPHGVFYVDGELGRRDMKMRIERLMKGHEFVPQNFHVACFEDQLSGFLPDLEQTAGQDRFIASIPDGVSVIVLDSLSTLTEMAESNDYASWSNMQRFLLKLRRLGYSVVVVHHANKGGNEQAGTSRRIHVMETVVSLRKHESPDGEAVNGHNVEIHITKGRNLGPQQKEPFIATLNSYGEAMTWLSAELAPRKREQIEQMLADGVPAGSVIEETGAGHGYVYRIRSQMIASGQLGGARQKPGPKKDRWST